MDSSLPGLVERARMRQWPDLVDHHRRHRDGVPARPGRLTLEVFGRRPDLDKELGGFVDDRPIPSD
jgi:hypothetical protein